MIFKFHFLCVRAYFFLLNDLLFTQREFYCGKKKDFFPIVDVRDDAYRNKRSPENLYEFFSRSPPT